MQDGTTQFLVALGFSAEMNINAEGVMKAIVPDRLFRTVRPPELPRPKHEQILEVRTDAVVPANETTYWCAVAKLPRWVQKTKHHIVKVGPGRKRSS